MLKRTFLKNQGFKYDLDSKSLLVQIIAMTKENHIFSEDQLKSLVQATSKYLEQVGNIPLTKKFHGNISGSSDKNNYTGPFYKFISKKTYEKYISKGKFQLGSLEYYRKIENSSSRDEKEGFSNLIIKSGNRQIFSSVLSGFDKLILCGTNDITQKNMMRKKFGDYLMIIPNYNTFAEKVKEIIDAERWEIKTVEYNDYKSGAIEKEIHNYTGVSPDLSEEFFKILIDASENPSVFIKPNRFQLEKELRLSFTMTKPINDREFFDFPEILDEIKFEFY